MKGGLSFIHSGNHSPVHVDAGFGKHEVPQVQEGRLVVDGGKAVVDQQASVGYPQRGKDGDDTSQHLDHLQERDQPS